MQHNLRSQGLDQLNWAEVRNQHHWESLRCEPRNNQTKAWKGARVLSQCIKHRKRFRLLRFYHRICHQQPQCQLGNSQQGFCGSSQKRLWLPGASAGTPRYSSNLPWRMQTATCVQCCHLTVSVTVMVSNLLLGFTVLNYSGS